MCFYAVFPSYKNSSCFEFCFHDPEVFFDLPAASVDVDDFTDISFQVRYHCTETVIHGFFPDTLFIQLENLFLCDLSVTGNCCFLNETGRIVRIFSFPGFIRGLHDPDGTFDLTGPDPLLVCLVFRGVCDDNGLVHVFRDNGVFFVINSVVHFGVGFIQCGNVYELV